MKYNVQLKVYEGPLDLLYDMISKQKIDIKDISIIDITKQYINYITALEKMDLEVASEFITMASKLLEIKSRYLLYKQKDNNEVEDPRLELMEKLEEYKKFKLASQDLKDNITYVDDLYYRKKEEIIIDDTMDLDDISIDAIKNILPYILKVKSEDNKPQKDEKLEKIVRGRIVPVEEKIAYIREIISRDNEVSFIKVIENVDKDEVIATFLSAELIAHVILISEVVINFTAILLSLNILNTFAATPLVCFIPKPTKENLVISSSTIIFSLDTNFSTTLSHSFKSSFAMVNETLTFPSLGAV